MHKNENIKFISLDNRIILYETKTENVIISQNCNELLHSTYVILPKVNNCIVKNNLQYIQY